MNIEIKDNLKVAQALALLEYAFDSYNDENYFDVVLAARAYHYLWEAIKIDSVDFNKLLDDVHHNKI